MIPMITQLISLSNHKLKELKPRVLMPALGHEVF